MFRSVGVATVLFAASAVAIAQQLPPDAVQLDKVKIAEKITAEQFDPVTNSKADPDLPTFSHDGVTYGSSAADSKAAFEADPAKYIENAEKERWIANFMDQMSIIWCPVTDEIGPGNLTQWKELGYDWESCCTFCDQTVLPDHFPLAIERLRKRAEKAYALQEGRYVEGASSPVEGAINANAGAPTMEGDDPEFVPQWVKDSTFEATYSGGVAKIIEYRCLECHQPGGAAPMPLQSYADVRKWADKLKDIISAGSMPPWPADKGIGTFSNTKRLTEKEKEVFLAWIDAKFPRGDGDYAMDGVWSVETPIGEVDAEVQLEEYEIPADVIEQVREVEIDFENAEDQWVVASHAAPIDWFLAHSINMLPAGIHFPGNSAQVLPEGYGRKLPGGTKIDAKIHYVKEEGWEEYDETMFAVRFAEDAGNIKTEVLTDAMENTEFVIPAGEAAFEAVSTFTFEKAGKILGLNPAMHMRGKSAVYTLKTPDGKETPILSISRWDPKWQYTYWFAEPIAAPKGSVVTLTGTFDNSADNVLNPDHEAEVKAGVNGEVLQGWIQYAID